MPLLLSTILFLAALLASPFALASANDHACQAPPHEALTLGRPGRVAQLHVKVGDKVRTNQPLATLDCADAKAELTIAEAELEIQRITAERRSLPADTIDLQIAKNRLSLAEADLSMAEGRRTRLESAFNEKGLISQQELEIAARRAMVARVDVSTARQLLQRLENPILPLDERELSAQEKIRIANVARARYQISLCEITAAADGIVTTVHIRPGDLVSAMQPAIQLSIDSNSETASALRK